MPPENPSELQTLPARYAALVDERRFDELDQVFTADAILETGRGRRDGLASIHAAMQGLHRYDRTEHLVLDVEVEVGDSRASGTVESRAHHWFTEDGQRRDHQMEITYHDEYVETAAGWRIANRRLEIHRAATVDADSD